MNTIELKDRKKKVIASNRKARHDFEIIQTIESGIVLQGTEVKSLRAGKCSFQDAYAAFPDKNNYELFLYNFHISQYEHGNRNNHEPKRPRKLLLNKREAIKLCSSVQEKGLTLIPLSIYFSGPFVKLELALVRAKKKFDKREDLKKREATREINKKLRI